MIDDTALHRMSALEMAAAVRARQVSPVELVDDALARLDALSDQVGAFVTVTADVAREQARAAERQVRGADPASLPPLIGVPTAVKDLNLTTGIRTMFGSATMRDFVPSVDDELVVRLRASGAISLGKTNTPEFGAPCYTEPEVAPPARTPWDLDRSAGGSSGGAGAAVSAGIVPVAHGSDGGGSIRIPASVCGLVGLKPTRGRVSRGPVRADVTNLSVEGSLTRTVRDTAAMLDVLAGYATGDPAWAPPLPAGQTFLAVCEQDPGALRIARTTRNPLSAPVDPEVEQQWERTSRQLADLGHDVVDLPDAAMDFGHGLFDAFIVAWTVNMAVAPVDPAREEQLRPLTRWLRAEGRKHSAVDLALALTTLQTAARTWITATDEYDAVLTPTLAQPPALVGQLRDDDDPAADFAAQGRWTPFTSMVNMTGQPAISLPLGQTTGGLPVGMHLIGRPADEVGLLRLAAQLESAHPWSGRHPDCW